MSAIGVLAELADAFDCDVGADNATDEANAAKAAGGVLNEPSLGVSDDIGIVGRVWVADVLLLLGLIPALVAARHYAVVAKTVCPDFDADQTSWCDATTKLRRECFAAALVSVAGYVLTAHYGAAIDEQWQGGAALGLSVIGCVWGARSAVKLSRMGGLPNQDAEEAEA